jgi:hypothetical protein
MRVKVIEGVARHLYTRVSPTLPAAAEPSMDVLELSTGRRPAAGPEGVVS